jgi:hypothetical protein
MAGMSTDPAGGLHQCMTSEQYIALRTGTPVADHQGRIGIVTGADGYVTVAYGDGISDFCARYDAFDVLGPCVLRWDGERWTRQA